MKFTLSWLKDHLETDATTGQVVAAFAVVQAALVTLHLPTGVQTDTSLVHSTPVLMLQNDWHLVTSPQGCGSSGLGGMRLQPAGSQTCTQDESFLTQVCAVTLQTWLLALQVCVVVLQVCAVPVWQ